MSRSASHASHHSHPSHQSQPNRSASSSRTGSKQSVFRPGPTEAALRRVDLWTKSSSECALLGVRDHQDSELYRTYYQCRLSELKGSAIPLAAERQPIKHPRRFSLVPWEKPSYTEMPAEPKQPLNRGPGRLLGRSASMMLGPPGAERRASANAAAPQEAAAEAAVCSQDGSRPGSRPNSQGANVPGAANAATAAAGPQLDDEYVKAMAAIKTFKFFSRFDKNILKEIPNVVKFTSAPKGSVLFRQGDPPRSCYGLLEGSVAFFVGGDAKSPRKGPSDGTENMQVPPYYNEETRIYTLERYSTFAGNSNLGTKVGQTGSGAIFGELALLSESQPRAATIKCLEDCVFLEIPVQAFKMLEARMREMEAEKKSFLKEHVPEMKCNHAGPRFDSPHPTHFFQDHTFYPGEILLRQGIIEDPVLYVLYGGVLEFRHRKQSEHNDIVVELKKPGSVFGTLPVPGREPFTLMCKSQAEVFFVRGTDFNELPNKLLKAIQAHIVHETAPRLRLTRMNIPMGWNRPLCKNQGTSVKEANAARLADMSARDLQGALMGVVKHVPMLELELPDVKRGRLA